MSLSPVKKHWIIFRKLDTRISIFVNLLISQNKKEVKHDFKQDLTKKRPYLIIEESQNKLLILTLTKSKKGKNRKEKAENPSWGKFGPLKCPCLTVDTYVILDTKILLTWEFAKKYSLDLLTRNNDVEHDCLPEKQFFKLREALEVYWNTENEQLTLIELGNGKNNKVKK